VLAGVGAYAAREGVLERGRSPASSRGAGAARAQIQQRHLPNVPLSPMTAGGALLRRPRQGQEGRAHLRLEPRAARVEKVTDSLATMQDLFGKPVGRDMFLYSIARTPEHDTPRRLNRWAVWSGAGPGWKFLTGAPADVERCAAASASPPTIRPRTRNRRYAVGVVRYGAEREMRWGHCQSQGPAGARPLRAARLRRGSGRPELPRRRRLAAAGGGSGARLELPAAAPGVD
jgi:hypothetical protein